jgi:hypothetical protein
MSGLTDGVQEGLLEKFPLVVNALVVWDHSDLTAGIAEDLGFLERPDNADYLKN